MTKTYPLAVDLDGTLLKNDSLIEMFIFSLMRRPWETLLILLSLLGGRANFKNKLAQINKLDISNIPLREEFYEYLLQEKSKGRELFLVTAADQSVADDIHKKLGIFKEAIGSANGYNLKGKKKLKYLQSLFPDGFSYAGDSLSDIAIWREAKSIILVSNNRKILKSAKSMKGNIEQTFFPKKASLRIWMKSLRIHQWSKNLLIFLPLLLSHQYSNFTLVANVIVAFFCMGLIASGTYLINDISDLEADRSHKTKKFRPIASGDIGTGSAFVVALLSILSGLLIASVVSLQFLMVLFIYLILTLTYSFYLKKVPMLDVFSLGVLYTLRIVMGTVVIGALFSSWLLMFSIFFFFSLSLAKRYVEIIDAETAYNAEYIKGRGYKVSDAPIILSFGIATSTLSLLILTLYVANEAYPKDIYNNPEFLWGITPIVLLWIMRIWFLSHRREMKDDPVAFALRDAISWCLGFLILTLFVIAIY